MPSEYGSYSETVTESTFDPDVIASLPKFYKLFLLEPEVIFAARVNQPSFSYPLSSITFDTVTTGSYDDILVGMTAYFGSSAGARDGGSQRIRALATSSVLSIGRSSQGIRPGEVDLLDNDYITVVNLREVWSRPPFINADGSVQKDPGLDVEWRTTTPPPICNIGSARVRTIDEDTGEAVFTFPSEGAASYVTTEGATITTYAWSIADGSIIEGDIDEATITLSFPAGFRYVSLTITDSEGHSSSMHVPVIAEDPDNSLMVPFQFASHVINDEGQAISVRVLQSILSTVYPPGTLAIIWYGEPEDLTDASNLIFMGWMGDIPDEIEAQREGLTKQVEIELMDVAARMNQTHAFSQAVEDDSARNTTQYPAITWFHMVDLNIDKYVHYLLAWHSTVLSLVDFYWSDTGSTYAAITLHSDGQSFWDQCRQRVEQMIPAWKLTCDRHGAIRMLPDPMIQEVADRTSVVQAELTEADWFNLRFVNRHISRAHWLKRWAIQGGEDVVTAGAAQILAGEELIIPVFVARAPGDTPGQGAEEVEGTEGIVESQLTLNQATGHQYARMNAFQSEFRVTLTGGDDYGIEPALLEWVELTTPISRRGLQLTTERMLPKEVRISYNQSRNGVARTIELLLERETSGTPAVTYIPPMSDTVPGDDDTWPGDWTAPPPGTVPDPIPVPPLPLYEGQEKVAIIDKYGQIFTTENFTSGGSDPDWSRFIPLTGPGGGERIHSFVVNPFSPLYRGLGTTVNGWVATEHYIYFLDDIFGSPTYTQIYEFVDIANPDLQRFRSIQASFGRFFSEESDNPWLICVSHYGSRPGFEGTWWTYSIDGGQTWSTEDRFTSIYPVDQGEDRDGTIGLWLSPRTPGYAITFTFIEPDEDYIIGEARHTTDWGASWSVMTDPVTDPISGLGGDLHIPWPDNDNENVLYFGAWDETGDPHDYNLRRTNSGGTMDAFISPSHDSRTWGVNRYSFGIRTYDNDRRYVALAGIAQDTGTEESDTWYAAFVSNNYGNTWTNIVDTLLKTDPHPEHIAFAADTEQVLYIWGTERYIAASYDFGATIIDKSGNMPTDFVTDVRDIIGLCGGDAPA